MSAPVRGWYEPLSRERLGEAMRVGRLRLPVCVRRGVYGMGARSEEGPRQHTTTEGDVIKALVFLEYARCPITESTGVLMFYQAGLGMTKVPRPRTLWKYRAKRSMARILKELQREAGEEAWMKETIAGVDSTGISHYKLNGTTRR